MSEIVPFDIVTQYVDNGEGTVTVDPIRKSSWILPGQGLKHQQGELKSRLMDMKALASTQDALRNAQDADDEVMYTPSADHLLSLPGFASRPKGLGSWYGEEPRAGRLPVIEQMRRDGAFIDIPTPYLEEQAYRQRQTVGLKAASRAGAPDHGLASYDYQ